MIVKPTLMQATIQRSQDINSIKHQEDSKSAAAQNNIQTTVQKEIRQKLSDVNKKDNADYNEQRHDAKEKGKNEYFSQKKSSKKKESDADEDGRVIVKKKSNFDVKI